MVWLGGAEPTGLGDLAGGGIGSHAAAISADGSIVVGQGTSASGNEAFRWTIGAGMVGLGDLDGGLFFSEASAISADGSWIVGSGYSATGSEAFIWDTAGGMRPLEDFMRDEWGLVFDAGWVLTAATAISDEGGVIVGYGLDPDGVRVGFVATVPEPTSAALAGAGLAAIAAARRSAVRRFARHMAPSCGSRSSENPA